MPSYSRALTRLMTQVKENTAKTAASWKVHTNSINVQITAHLERVLSGPHLSVFNFFFVVNRMFSSSLFGIDLWGRVGRKWSQQHWSGLQVYLWNPRWRAFCYQGSQSGTAEMWRAPPRWCTSGVWLLRCLHFDVSVKLSKHLRAAGIHLYMRVRVPEL